MVNAVSGNENVIVFSSKISSRQRSKVSETKVGLTILLLVVELNLTSGYRLFFCINLLDVNLGQILVHGMQAGLSLHD